MPATLTFQQLGVSPSIVSALTTLGYETPTPIQEQSIPVLMSGDDLLAQAQTGTGKTAAFALPILSNLDLAIKQPQALIIAPTRELAIQVAEAFQSYSKQLKGFQVTPIYGGQDYQIQLRALKRGSHVIVGTPGRVMDHLRRGTLRVDALKTLVLDEGDEMLKMGFKEDVEWILGQIPCEHQTALFSATMPATIQQIAKRYLNNAKKIQIKPKESTVNSIEQFYTRVSRTQKMDLLTRFLEVEDVQAALIFSRTKTLSAELAEKLQARGYAAAALNGDMSQSLREKVLSRLKKGSLDIVVATDVAARGIDVDRISHVFNYDIPCDPESYIHRIGRTGRAGRKGKAFLFVSPREQHLLNAIERAVHKPIEQIAPPSLQQMSELRGRQLADKIVNIIHKSDKYKPYRNIIDDIVANSDCVAEDIAAALAYLVQESNPLPSEEMAAAEAEMPQRGRKGRGSFRSRKRSSGGRSGGGNRSFSGGSSKPSGRSSRSSDGSSKPSSRTSRPSSRTSNAATKSPQDSSNRTSGDKRRRSSKSRSPC